jgi:hypothetical protein
MAVASDPAVTALAACGVPATSAWSANDSALLTGASAADVEGALRDAAEQASAHVRKEVKEAKRSERKRRELAEHVLSKGGHALLARVHAKLAEHGVDLPSVQVRALAKASQRGPRHARAATLANAAACCLLMWLPASVQSPAAAPPSTQRSSSSAE